MKSWGTISSTEDSPRVELEGRRTILAAWIVSVRRWTDRNGNPHYGVTYVEGGRGHDALVADHYGFSPYYGTSIEGVIYVGRRKDLVP